MSNRDKVRELERELAFWREVHKYESPDEREFDLEEKIRRLENRDQYGVPRYNGDYKR